MAGKGGVAKTGTSVPNKSEIYFQTRGFHAETMRAERAKKMKAVAAGFHKETMAKSEAGSFAKPGTIHFSWKRPDMGIRINGDGTATGVTRASTGTSMGIGKNTSGGAHGKWKAQVTQKLTSKNMEFMRGQLKSKDMGTDHWAD